MISINRISTIRASIDIDTTHHSKMTSIATISDDRTTNSTSTTSNKKPRKNDFQSDHAALSSILKKIEDVGVNILSYLEAKVCAELHEVNSEWHHFLIENEDKLFASYLVNDFAEGQVLQYVANQRNLSYKKLYMAFLKRWCLHKQGKGTRISVSYRGSSGWLFPNNDNTEFSKQINGATSQFVFIARHGSYGKDSTACALLEWDPECELKKCRLRIDEKWTKETGGMATTKFCEDIFFDREDMVMNSAELTVHVVDLKFYSVATLMNEALPEHFPTDDITQRRLEMKVSDTDFECEWPWLCKELPRCVVVVEFRIEHCDPC